MNDDIRPGETATVVPQSFDAGVFFIGIIRTPWASRQDCPKRGTPDGPDCRIELLEPWQAALDGIEEHRQLQVLYWMHLSRRDLTRQRPRFGNRTLGTFGTRSPVRPNPIASSSVGLLRREGPVLIVRGLDCVDGTPLIDLKPERCPAWPAIASGPQGSAQA